MRFKKIVRNRQEGKITYGDGIVDNIVLLAVSELPYVELFMPVQRSKNRNSAVKIIYEKDGIRVDVTVKIHYTQSVSDVAFKIQEAIRRSVESMTDYRISNVNVDVKGIIFDEMSSNTKQKKIDKKESMEK